MKIKTSPAGRPGNRNAEAGFTLFELLAVLAIVSFIAGAIAVYMRTGTKTASLRSIAVETAARLRETRALAINQGSSRVVLIDIGRRIISTDNRKKPLKIANGIKIAVTAAAGEQRTSRVSGIRFLPNGSSTGGTVRFSRGQQAFEVRVNWLTGRVSLDTAH